MEFLRFNLCFLYRLMVAAVPLMQFALARSDGVLADYYLKHIPEELGHDEMLRKDLEQLDIVEIPQYFEASMIAGSQYYLIAHDHPSLLLGYIYAMEVNAPKLEYVEFVQKQFGIRLDCMTHHANADPWHVEELEKLIATLDDDLQHRIRWNENHTIRMLNAAMKGHYGAAVPLAA